MQVPINSQLLKVLNSYRLGKMAGEFLEHRPQGRPKINELRPLFP